MAVLIAALIAILVKANKNAILANGLPFLQAGKFARYGKTRILGQNRGFPEFDYSGTAFALIEKVVMDGRIGKGIPADR